MKMKRVKKKSLKYLNENKVEVIVLLAKKTKYCISIMYINIIVDK